jgi:hypothetical protein
VGGFLGLLFLGLMVQFFLNSRAQSEKPRAAMLLLDTAYAGLHILERDLQESSVLSIGCYPNPQAAGERPGLSLLSACTREKDSHLVVGPFGHVLWQKYVYYSLRPIANSQLAELVRDEGPLDDQPHPADINHRIPMPSGLLPSQAPGTPSLRRTVFHSLAANGGFVARLQGDTVIVELMLVSDPRLFNKQSSVRVPIQVKPCNF